MFDQGVDYYRIRNMLISRDAKQAIIFSSLKADSTIHSPIQIIDKRGTGNGGDDPIKD